MKTYKNQASSIASLSALAAESKLCFGAAGGCFLIGSAGYVIDALTTSETTLSAFLVISAFYLLLGVINMFQSAPERAAPTVGDKPNSADHHAAQDELIESAA